MLGFEPWALKAKGEEGKGKGRENHHPGTAQEFTCSLEKSKTGMRGQGGGRREP